MKVLLVDDDKIIRYGLKKIIEKSGDTFTVVGEANNGLTALDMITNTKPDIVITDIKMPVMDGLELITKIKENKIKCKVIALSGFDEYKFVRESLKNGAIDYLLKPIDNQDLINLLNSAKKDIEDEEIAMNEYVNDIESSKNIINEKILNKLLSNDENIDENLIEKINKLDISEFKIAIISFKVLKENNISKLLNEIKISLVEKINVISDNIIICEYEKNIVLVYKCEFNDKINKLLELIIMGKKNIIYYMDYIKSGNIKQEYDKGIGEILQNFYGEEIKYVDMLSSNNQKDIDEIYIKLISNIELLDKNNLVKNFEVIFKLLKQNQVSPKVTIHLLNKLIDVCKLKIDDFNKVYEENQFIQGVVMKDYIYYIKNLEEGKKDIINFFSDLIDNIKKTREGRSDRIIEFAKDYIKENYNKSISLSDVANKVYLNPNYLSELFKKKAGKNFIEYLVELRISVAKEKLKVPGIKIYEVANEVGYKEQVSFNRAFKRIVGISPKEYMNLVK